MWALSNRTPYSAERGWTRDKDGVHHWTVAVKATFRFDAKGGLELDDEQPLPLVAPEWRGEPGKSSLKYDGDLGLMKPTTDVTLLGSAYAPKGKVATSVPVRMRFGRVDKSLIVFGDRVYETSPVGVVLSSSARFAKKEILYEEAWGGMDTSHPDPQAHGYEARNPVGRGFATRSSLHGKPAHCVEFPQGLASKLGPAGFGPIDRAWKPRLDHAGTYDGEWAKNRRPLLPNDYDPRFELCAPVDQRPSEYIAGGERIELTNLSEEGLLVLELPKVYLTFRTKIGKHSEEHRSRLASLILEPDERRLALIWQTALKVRANRVEHVDETIIAQKPYLT